MDPMHSANLRLLILPPEVLLHIFLYLDFPDIASLAIISPTMAAIGTDPALQRVRILVVAPSRLSHALFEKSPPRPTVAHLVRLNVLKGLGIERRWRAGIYIYSAISVKQYENLIRLRRSHTSNVLSTHLRKRPPARGALLLASLHNARILPDVEYSSTRVSRSLLPVMRELKWSIQKDRLAKAVRNISDGGIARWLDGRGRSLVTEGERVRLALCPDVRRIVRLFEQMNVQR